MRCAPYCSIANAKSDELPWGQLVANDVEKLDEER